VTLLFVHSPLVGPSTWHPVARLLAERGVPGLTPSLSEALAGGPPFFPRIASTIASEVPSAQAVVLVVHSGAGALVPVIASAVTVVGAVYVDAILPAPGRSWFDTAPPDLAAHVRGLAGADGLLPPWHTWFGPSAPDELLPDPDARAAFVAEVPRLPLAYFSERTPASGPALPWSAYVQLSSAYDDEAATATREGWPLVRLDADHLAPVTRPALVAEALGSLPLP